MTIYPAYLSLPGLSPSSRPVTVYPACLRLSRDSPLQSGSTTSTARLFAPSSADFLFLSDIVRRRPPTRRALVGATSSINAKVTRRRSRETAARFRGAVRGLVSLVPHRDVGDVEEAVPMESAASTASQFSCAESRQDE